MAAMRKADSENVAKLTEAFPDTYAELYARYNAPGGLLPSDPREGDVVTPPPSMVVKCRWVTLGGHTHVRTFVGVDLDHLQLAGTLVFDVDQFELYRAALLSATSPEFGVVFVEDPS
jgi:hypothetical protein